MKKENLIYGAIAFIFAGFFAYYLTGWELLADIVTVLVLVFLGIAVLLMMLIPIYVWLRRIFNKKR